MGDTKWKNLGGKEGFSNKPLKNEPPSPVQFPSNYPISESSTNNDTIKRIKKIKKTRLENPKKIPILENIYESEEDKSDSVFSSPEDIFTHFFESPQSFKEGLTLPSNLKIKPSPGSDPNQSASDKVNDFIDKKTKLLNSNLTLSQKAYADKMTETRAKIDKLKYNIFNIDKMSTDFSEDINAKPPPSSPANENIMKQQSQDAEKEASDAIRRIGYVIKLMIDKLIKWINLGIEKFKLGLYKFVLKYKYIVTSTAQALTGYELQPDGTKKYYATETEIKTFSHEIVRFLTILMSWIFLYNWYYLMFFLNPEQQFKLNLNNWYENHSMIYAAFGPSLRSVELLDWFILEFLPRIRYLIPSNGILFFIMSIIFIALVQQGKQWTIMTDFFNAINKSYTTSIISAFVITCIVFYGLSFAGYFATLFNFALVRTWYTALLWVVITVIYLLCIITLGVPIGVLAVCGFIFFYSFFAIVLYNGLDIFPVLAAISEQITNVSSINQDTSNMTWGQWAYNTLQKFVKYFLYFMFEIFILYILINGLVIYIKGYNVPLAEKATLNNAYSTAGAFKAAFHHLYTWLIIINVLLIILVFVFMKIRYDAIKNLAPGQPFNDTGESMYKRLLNTGSSIKNSVLEKYNQAGSLKNTLSQNTILGKARMPFSGKAGAIKNAATSSGASELTALMGSGAGAGMPGLINGLGGLDSKTTNSVMSSAITTATEVAKDQHLGKAVLSAASGAMSGNTDLSKISSEIAQADNGTLNKIIKEGSTAAGAVANDPSAIQSVAKATGADPSAVANLTKTALSGATMAANEASKHPELIRDATTKALAKYDKK